jgi:16S rRNA (guanine527-N7)-methyltransferase
MPGDVSRETSSTAAGPYQTPPFERHERPLPKPTNLSSQEFAAGQAFAIAGAAATRACASLYCHYQELLLWSQRLALMGPQAEEVILERHYGEGLAALPMIPASARFGIDIGSGAGFPGLVIAAARPDIQMTLTEARERKWSFLATAARKASLNCRCLNARVASPLPAGIADSLDLVTARALKLEMPVLAALAERLSPEGRILLWIGERDPELPPELVATASVPLAGGHRRRILELRAAGSKIQRSEHS